MAGFHDSRYKYLFKHKLMVERLMKSFVHEKFVRHLDFSTMERLDKSFVTEEFKEKESDIIWKLRYKNKPFYIFLLIEFQSTVDYSMPLRFFRYIAEFYQALQLNPKNDKYPAVFPLLLYNGEEIWDVPSSIQELIEPSISKQYIPHFEYSPIIINLIPENTLLKIHNAVSAIFLTENTGYNELETRIDFFISIIHDEVPELKRIFDIWFTSILENRTDMDHIVIRNRMSTLQEEKEMFTTTVQKYGRKFLEQGIEQGIERGEHKKALSDARNMKEYGIETDIICKVTGLSEEIVKEL
ncbi:MAG: Rpn family recombination-promoting nuclease/putative transposase [Spirochaetales bacterium]|nr:Rpn family recombination-promoting nuclease/putative transposase [Spirochaetales bacterium]